MSGPVQTIRSRRATGPHSAARTPPGCSIFNVVRILAVVLLAGCGDGTSTTGPVFETPSIRVDASGQAAAQVGPGGDLLVESAIYTRGVLFTIADSLGRALRGAMVEYRETADSLVTAHVTDPTGAHRRGVYIGNPAVSPEAGGAGAGALDPLEVPLTLSTAADLDPHYAGPTYIAAVDAQLHLGSAAADRVALSEQSTCLRLSELPELLREGSAAQGSSSQTAWAGITLELYRTLRLSPGADVEADTGVPALSFEEAARFTDEAMLDRLIRFIELERPEDPDPVDGNTIATVRESSVLQQLLPEFSGRHLDLVIGAPSNCGAAVEEVTMPLPGGATMTFVWIDRGVFTMGSPPSPFDTDLASDEEPEREVTITSGFWLGKFEVTQRQWESVMALQPWAAQPHVELSWTNPACYVSWNDAQELVARLNQVTGEDTYRLPTEAEWEYACRAGTVTQWSFGNDEGDLDEHGWYFDNAWDDDLDWAQPVGGKMANPWGLFDMHGNLYEWCWDWYGPYAAGSQIDPAGPDAGEARVVRGGAFFQAAQHARSADRSDRPPGYQYYDVGLRLVMEPEGR